MINVACLRWGAKFPPFYVNHLFWGVKRHLSLPFKFHCLTDSSQGLHPEIEQIPLKYKDIGERTAGWWFKPYLFANENGLKGRTLYLDLDTLIVGDIDHLASCPKSFVVLQDFMHPANHNMGSGIMLWTAGEMNHLWTKFYNNNPKAIAKKFHPHGDQRYIQREQAQRDYWQKLFPGEVVSYKLHCKDGRPKDAKVICYHGRPSIQESITKKTVVPKKGTIPPSPWVKEHWKDGI